MKRSASLSTCQRRCSLWPIWRVRTSSSTAPEGRNAIVVAEAKPECVPSSYKNTVVGLLAKPENEPAVARTFRLGVGTKQMKAVTQENGSTIQSVEPIRNGSHIIGVLILEKRVDEQRQVSERIHFSQQSFETIAHALAQMVPETTGSPSVSTRHSSWWTAAAS